MESLDKKFDPEGKYFLFNVRDDYSARCRPFDEDGDGFELYKFEKGEMKGIITLPYTPEGFVPEEEEIVDYLKKNNIKEIYNPSPELIEEYRGAESYDEPDDDGDMLSRVCWFSGLMYPFKIDHAGIKMIGFD